MKRRHDLGHFAALVTILIWATTFVSTKVLLVEFQPIAILFYRFAMGFIVLLLVYPRKLSVKNKKQELYFAGAGLSGICVYYLLENIALTYTQASNVGVIISVAPFFTAILSAIFLKKEEKLKVRFFAGFAMAMLGILLISLKGTAVHMNPIGDLLSLLAALAWGCYSVLTKKISEFGYHSIQTTRRVFAYGLLFMTPALIGCNFKFEISKFSDKVYLFNILFLGVGASALCFVTWNYAVKVLGAVKTSIYIYLVPVITVLASALILNEQITYRTLLGIVLTVAGLFVSEERQKRKREEGVLL